MVCAILIVGSFRVLRRSFVGLAPFLLALLAMLRSLVATVGALRHFYYGKITKKVAQYGDDRTMDFFINLYVWGTPEQYYDKIVKI